MVRKGFTMIELIFVIVILGILAAVAIPRLAATRADAAIAAAAETIANMKNSIPAYAMSQGTTTFDIKNAINLPGEFEAYTPTGGTAGYAIQVDSIPVIYAYIQNDHLKFCLGSGLSGTADEVVDGIAKKLGITTPGGITANCMDQNVSLAGTGVKRGI